MFSRNAQQFNKSSWRVRESRGERRDQTHSDCLAQVREKLGWFPLSMAQIAIFPLTDPEALKAQVPSCWNARVNAAVALLCFFLPSCLCLWRVVETEKRLSQSVGCRGAEQSSRLPTLTLWPLGLLESARRK